MANAAEFLARWKVRYIDAEGRILEELDTTVAECVEDANEEGFSREDLDQAAGGDLKAYIRKRSPYSFTSTLRRRIKQTESRVADNHEPFFNTINPIRTSGRHVNNHERLRSAEHNFNCAKSRSP